MCPNLVEMVISSVRYKKSQNIDILAKVYVRHYSDLHTRLIGTRNSVRLKRRYIILNKKGS
jgi:hypothetical protein